MAVVGVEFLFLKGQIWQKFGKQNKNFHFFSISSSILKNIVYNDLCERMCLYGDLRKRDAALIR